MLRTYIKIGLTWAVVAGVVFSITLALPHREVTTVSTLLASFDVLVAISCFFVARNEFRKSTRLVFIYMGIFFSFTALGWPVHALMSRTFFQGEPFASFYWRQYHWILYFFMLLFVIAFGVFEIIVQKLAIYRKVLLGLIVAVIPILFLYYPILLNPKYLYTVSEVRDYSVLSKAVKQSKERGDGFPTVGRLALDVLLPSQDDHQSFEQKYQRVAEIFPYLPGSNYVPLVLKPLHITAIYLSAIALLIILAMLGYLYKNDRPKPAYLEKILIAFIPVCVLECIHAYAYIVTTDFQTFWNIYIIGNILTRLAFGFILIFIVLRLRFILSPAGNFYENKLSTDPLQVSRWRDFFDEFIIRRFLNPGKFKRRLFLIRDASETPSSPTLPHQ